MVVTRKKKEDNNMVVKTVVEAQDIFDKAWEGFKGEDWKEKASVSRFVQANYTPLQIELHAKRWYPYG